MRKFVRTSANVAATADSRGNPFTSAPTSDVVPPTSSTSA